LAIVVIGGLITSTLLTLVVVPAVYRFFDDAPVGSQVEDQQEPMGAHS
jgi:Cu/Ag efflux pump CusA